MRCPNCKEKVARFPIKKQPEKTLAQNFEEGTINWWNFFKIDLVSLMWIVVIIILVISYKADIKKYEEMITDPIGYCEESNACKVIEERRTNPYKTVDIENIPEFNIT